MHQTLVAATGGGGPSSQSMMGLDALLGALLTGSTAGYRGQEPVRGSTLRCAVRRQEGGAPWGLLLAAGWRPGAVPSRRARGWGVCSLVRWGIVAHHTRLHLVCVSAAGAEQLLPL